MRYALPVFIVAALLVLIGVGWWLGGGAARTEPASLTAPDSSRVPTQRAVDAPPSALVSDVEIPDVVVKNYDGNDVRLIDFVGTPLVINSWAAWCPFCVKELPDFVTVQEELGDQVRFIAINRAESRATAEEFTDRLGVGDYLVFLLDPGDDFYQALGGFAMPETLFVNADGTINFHKRGPMAVDEIRQRTQAIIQ